MAHTFVVVKLVSVEMEAPVKVMHNDANLRINFCLCDCKLELL